MLTGDYQPHFEKDETERVGKIKKEIKRGNLDYLYSEFDFDDNEEIVNSYFDENDQLHIIYVTYVD